LVLSKIKFLQYLQVSMLHILLSFVLLL